MIELNRKHYEYEGSIPDYFEKVVLEENNLEPPGKKSLGDAYLDERTAVDVKTINVNGDFHMGNLASQDKIRKWLEDKQNSLMFFFIEYEEDCGVVAINSTKLKHIEEIHPDCLQISAQGLGVMQLKNWDKVEFISKMNRYEWFKDVYAPLLKEFISKEEKKLEKLRLVYDSYKD